AVVRSARLRRRLALTDAAVLRPVWSPVRRPSVPPVRARLFAAPGRPIHAADGTHADADLATCAQPRPPPGRASCRRHRACANGSRFPGLLDPRDGFLVLAFRDRGTDLRDRHALATAPATTAIVSSLPA